MSTSIAQYFSSSDYLLALPMLLLSLFGVGVLLIDLILPKQWKAWNAVTAMLGVIFAAVAVGKLHMGYRLAESKGIELTTLPTTLSTGRATQLTGPTRAALHPWFGVSVPGAYCTMTCTCWLEVVKGSRSGEIFSVPAKSEAGRMREAIRIASRFTAFMISSGHRYRCTSCAKRRERVRGVFSVVCAGPQRSC